MFPKNHQELLEEYITAELSHIGEFSGSIGLEAKELEREAKKYAQQYGLSVNEEWFSAYRVN